MIILLVIFIILITVILLYIKTHVTTNREKQEPRYQLPKCGGYNKPKKYIPFSYNIVTSCTTSPLRILKMKETLDSLENQTVSPTYMILNLPYVYARTNEQYVIPDYIQNNSNIVINRLEIDYGPATKLVGSILNIPKDEDTWIVVHDDDQLHLQNTIETYMEYINKIDNKKIAFTIAGFDIIDNKVIRYTRDLNRVQIFEGYCTFCVHRSVFEDDFLPYIQTLIKNKDCNLSDDLILSNYVAKKYVKIHQIYNKNLNNDLYWSLGCELEYGKETDALHVIASNIDNKKDDNLGGHLNKYLRVIQYLKQNDMFYLIQPMSRCGGYTLPKTKLNKPYQIITSCTTSPLRINKMHDTINSIENQTVSPTYMLLNLPLKFARTNQEYIIPDYIKNNSNIVINRFEMDYGPATKLVGAILKIPKSKDAWIIIHDDDNLYLQKTVETYTKYIDKFNDKRKAFTVSGFSFSPDFTQTIYKNEDLSILQLCEGFMSYCVHRSVFEDDFLPYIQTLIKNKDCNLSDDLIISNYISKKDVKIHKINSSTLSSDIIWSSDCGTEYGLEEDALSSMAKREDAHNHLGGHFPKYLRAIQYLKQNNMFYLN